MKISKLLFLVFLFFLKIGISQNLPEPSNPQRLVNDFTNLLTTDEQNRLEQKLVDFNNQTSTQICIVTLKSLDGYDIDDYAARLGEKWKVGKKGNDNGILILVKPKSQDEKGEIAISVGYGLEGVVPDAIAKRIVDNEIISEFKNGNFFAGLDKGTSTLISLTKGEFTASQYEKRISKPSSYGGGIVVLVILFVLISVFRSARRKTNLTSNGSSSLPFWLTMMMMSGMNSHRGRFGDFSSGSGSFGGFGGSSGSSFGGFGGGSFGGGGASGSW